MKKIVLALIAAVALAGPAAAASWPYSRLIPDVQSGSGRGQGGGGGRDRGESRRDPPPQQQPDRRSGRDERRDRMNDDDRRALHRDLEKADRELYRRRSQ
jgi:opacity protein-like surface antigen